MRSRYSAFALGELAYVLESWHPGTRPDRVDPDPGLRWVGLEVVATEGGGPGERRGAVEFRARWTRGAGSGVLAERSRFVRQSGRWWYVDGDVAR